MKFRRQNSLRSWASGPLICIAALAIGVWIGAPASLLVAGVLILFASLLAVEWEVVAGERAIIRRITLGFIISLLKKRYEVDASYQIRIKVISKGAKTQNGNFIVDYAELEMRTHKDTIHLCEGTDIDGVSSIGRSVAESLAIPFRRNEREPFNKLRIGL